MYLVRIFFFVVFFYYRFEYFIHRCPFQRWDNLINVYFVSRFSFIFFFFLFIFRSYCSFFFFNQVLDQRSSQVYRLMPSAYFFFILSFNSLIVSIDRFRFFPFKKKVLMMFHSYCRLFYRWFRVIFVWFRNINWMKEIRRSHTTQNKILSFMFIACD